MDRGDKRMDNRLFSDLFWGMNPTASRIETGAGMEVSTQVLQGTYFFDTVGAAAAAKSGLHALYGGVEDCAPDYRIERERFPYCSLELVVAGEGEVILNGRRHRLRPGAVFSYGKTTTVRIRPEPQQGLRKYFVCMQGGELASALGAAGLNEGQCRWVAQPFEIQRCWDGLIADGRSLSPGRSAVCAAQLHLLLVKLAHMPDAGATPLGGGAESTYLRCRAAVDQHAATMSSIEDIVARTGVARAHLSRLFRRFQGEAPYQYLIRRKMSLAAELLVRGDCLVKEAARQIGMSDPYHFSRLFKETHHLAPTAFRRLMTRGGSDLGVMSEGASPPAANER